MRHDKDTAKTGALLGYLNSNQSWVKVRIIKNADSDTVLKIIKKTFRILLLVEAISCCRLAVSSRYITWPLHDLCAASDNS